MTTSYNLLDEKWIRVVRLDGTPDVLSLVEVFQQASELEGIHGEIASQDAAIIRLLIAICHRAMDGPEHLGVWKEYWNSPGRLSEDAVAYLEEFRDRFDLRDPEKPFFQVAGIHSSSGKTSDLNSFIVDVPNGVPFFTTRIGSGLESMSWAEAARWLVHIHAFDPSGIRTGAVGDPLVKGGKGYPIGPGWTGQIGTVIVLGPNLEKTLLLNTVTRFEGQRIVSDPETDLPPWEREPDGPGGSSGVDPHGPVECYTWQSRRVLLHGDDDAVTSLFLGNGDRLTPQNRQDVEPMSAWRYSDPQSKKFKYDVYMPRKHNVDQALWRGLPALIGRLSPSTQGIGKNAVQRFLPPAVIRLAERLKRETDIFDDRPISVRAIGLEYGSQEAVTVELTDETLDLPASILDDPSTIQLVEDAMEMTDNVALLVRNLGANIDRASGGDPDTAASAGNRARAAFYYALDQEFPRWLADLDSKERIDAKRSWFDFVRQQALAQQQDLTSRAPDTAFAGRGTMDVARALAIFHASLNKTIPRVLLAPTSELSETPATSSEERNEK
ncbi:type I-E CRISPR-associated protein Cse1/CasA [Arcanobacterium haemolyticum]|nr:type I-E CRISPR-associated protein Cse1/CasA [Arcanobacterium haemolyticum]